MTEQLEKVRVRPRRKTLLSLAPALIAAALTGAFYILRGNAALMEKMTNGFALPARGALGDLTALVPFSVMELCYAVLILWGLVHLTRTAVILLRRKTEKSEKRRRLFGRAVLAVTVVLWIWAAGCWLWYTGYYSPGLAEKSDLEPDGVSVGELSAVTEFFVRNAVKYSAEVSRDENGHFAEEYYAYSGRIYSVYDNVLTHFPALDGVTRRPKEMLFSRLMSRLGFTGFYFAYTGETNINTDSPGCLIPSTLAHEAAHQRGVQAEDEADFAAIAACITCDDPVYRYSGYLLGTIHLMNALGRVSSDDWYEYYALFTDEMLTDWADNNEYWSRMETKVTEVSEKVYDSYLKANSQELGIQSYGACVDLLVEWLVVNE